MRAPREKEPPPAASKRWRMDREADCENVWHGRGDVLVVSELVEAGYLNGVNEGVGLHWLLSIMRKPLGSRKLRPRDLRRALRDFGMSGAEEDGGHIGTSRHFWLPVDPDKRRPAKTGDDPVGRWTGGLAMTGAKYCRGCTHERRTQAIALRKLGDLVKCPVHGEVPKKAPEELH